MLASVEFTDKEKVLWPEGYIGHEDEYVIAYQDKVLCNYTELIN